MAQGAGSRWCLVLVQGHYRRCLVLVEGNHSPVLAPETLLVLLCCGGQVQLGQQEEQQQEQQGKWPTVCKGHYYSNSETRSWAITLCLAGNDILENRYT